MTEIKNIVGDIKKKSIEALNSRITETTQKIKELQMRRKQLEMSGREKYSEKKLTTYQ